VTAESLSREGFSYTDHVRALEALTELPDEGRSDIWQFSLDRARSTIADYVTRNEQLPDTTMTFKDVEGTVRNSLLSALIAPQSFSGLIGSSSPGLTGLGKILSDESDEQPTRDGIAR